MFINVAYTTRIHYTLTLVHSIDDAFKKEYLIFKKGIQRALAAFKIQ